VKVCPHCAEELPNEATVCPECHKDPTQAPAWGTTGPSDESRPWWSSRSEGSDPGIPNTVPARYRGLEPPVAHWLGIPPKIRASLVIALAWGFVVNMLDEALLLVGFPASAGPVFSVLWVAGYTVGLILGYLGRAEVEDSDRVGHILAWGGIGLNGFRLLFFILSLAPALLIRLRSGRGLSPRAWTPTSYGGTEVLVLDLRRRVPRGLRVRPLEPRT
jgi:hypothetical protein